MEPLSGAVKDGGEGSLGARLRRLRLERGISLRALAQATGLTPSFLSQVERDLAEPSITSLRRIAEALSVPVFLLFVNSAGQSPVVRKHTRRMVHLPGSGLTYQLLVPDLNRQMEAIMTTVQPGGQTSEVPISHEGEEWTMVLRGRMVIHLADETYTLEEGDCIYYHASLPHLIRNGGEEELVVVSVMTPARF